MTHIQNTRLATAIVCLSFNLSAPTSLTDISLSKMNTLLTPVSASNLRRVILLTLNPHDLMTFYSSADNLLLPIRGRFPLRVEVHV